MLLFFGINARIMFFLKPKPATDTTVLRKMWERLVWFGLPKETASERSRLVQKRWRANRFFHEVIHKPYEMNGITGLSSERTD